MILEPIDAQTMKETSMDKYAAIAVCECGCKKFRILFQGDYAHTYCLHCKQTRQLNFDACSKP